MAGSAFPEYANDGSHIAAPQPPTPRSRAQLDKDLAAQREHASESRAAAARDWLENVEPECDEWGSQ